MGYASNRVIKTTTLLALILSILIAVALPLGYFILGYQHESAVLTGKVREVLNQFKI